MRWIITCITLAMLCMVNMAQAESWKTTEVGDMTVELPSNTSKAAVWKTVVWTQDNGRSSALEVLIYGQSGKEGDLTLQAFSKKIHGDYSLDFLVVSLLPNSRDAQMTISLVEPSGIRKMRAEGLVGTASMDGWTYTAAVYVSGGVLYALRTKHPTGERKYWRWINKFQYSFRTKNNKRLRVLP